MTCLLARRIGYSARNDVIYEERGPNSCFTNKTKKSTSKPKWNNQWETYYIFSWKNILLFSLTSQSQSRFGSVQACSLSWVKSPTHILSNFTQHIEWNTHFTQTKSQFHSFSKMLFLLCCSLPLGTKYITVTQDMSPIGVNFWSWWFIVPMTCLLPFPFRLLRTLLSLI